MTEKLREHIAKELLDVISLKGTPVIAIDCELKSCCASPEQVLYPVRKQPQQGHAAHLLCNLGLLISGLQKAILVQDFVHTPLALCKDR